MISNRFCIFVHYRNPFIVAAGTEKYIKNQIHVLKGKNIDSFVLFPVTKKIGISLFGWGVVLNEKFVGVWSEKRVIKYINSLVYNYSCQGVFIHHLKWSNLDSLGRIFSFTNSVVFYIHDYYSCCTQGNFLKNDKTLCKKKIEKNNCEGCDYYTGSIKLLEETKEFLDKFSDLKIIAPSEVAKDIWILTYPEYRERILVIEHLSITRFDRGYAFSGDTENKKVNVAFVGQGAYNKGWDEWKKTIQSLGAELLSKYNFYHLGSTKEKLEYVEQVPISMTQEGGTTMTKMLRKYEVDIAVLYSVWPETYGYTFYEALEAGCFVITSKDSGNIAKQTRNYHNGIVVNNEAESLENILRDYNGVVDMLNKYKAQQRGVYKTQHNEYYLKLLKTISNINTIRPKYIFGHMIAGVLYRLRYRKELEND